jgi:hypothetical protein
VIWAALVIACLIVWAELDCRRINRQRDNYTAIDAERIARENAAPLGNVSRWVEK